MTSSLSFHQVSRQYAGQSTPVLEQLSFAAQPGELIMITGPSGSGKSTLLQLGGLLDQPDSGDVRILGESVNKVSDTRLSRLRARHIGMVFQSYHLLMRRSILDNVRFRFRYLNTPPNEAKRLTLRAIEQVGLADMLSKSVRLLSGGEMQRVALARAIAAKPSVLLADEPTGNLDRKNSLSIMSDIKLLSQQGLTVIMVTHDESLLTFASRWFRVSDRQLVQKALPVSCML